ncbi:MAG: hypothetical protein L6R00_21190 [Phycisphaerae bacterium]|nr:hypothetical protein [Phycisphaerae bacterium]
MRRVLELHFDDTDSPECTDAIEAARIRLRQREAAAMGLRLTPPAPQDARRIIEFAESIRGMDGDLLCTCLGGVSRSTAAALICLATWSGPGREDECMKQLLAIRPCAAAHRDLIRFADELLNRGGRLSSAIERCWNAHQGGRTP